MLLLLPVSTLLSSLTPDQVKAKLYQLADTFGLKTTAWQKLSPLRTIFAIIAQLFSMFTVTQAQVNASAFLDTAFGVLLTLLAHYVYGVDRLLATFAKGQVTITNAAGGLYPYGPGELVVTKGPKGKAYANLAEVTINPLSTITIDVQALEAGSASNAGPGTINTLAAPQTGLSVTNATSLIGDDDETDDDLKQRCRDSLGALSPNGPKAAFEFFAKTPGFNGGISNITRVLVRPALGNGTIRVVVASADGEVEGPVTDPTTDLGKMFVALNKIAVTAGYTLLLSSAVVHNITPTVTIYVATSSGLSDDDAKQAVRDATTSYIPTIPIGGVDLTHSGTGYVLYRPLEAAMKAAAPGILEAKLDALIEADVALGATEVAVLDGFDLSSITVVQVAGA